MDELMFKVTGCGVSIVCPKGPSMMAWIQEILDKGGVPEIKKLSPEELPANG